MGIRGLNTYVDKRVDSLSTKIKLKDTKVIIDGNSLYHYLYSSSELDCHKGGQYNQFHRIVSSFFERLASKNVQAFVVLDGASDPSNRKLETTRERTEDSLLKAQGLADGIEEPKYVRPMLLGQTFLQTLSKKEVPFAVCDCEADEEIASLAIEWDCPVISNDSDFFIFDLKGGYVPLKYLTWRSGQLKAKLFRVGTFSKHLLIQKELLPLLASLVGNDFVGDDVRLALYSALKISEPLYTAKIIEGISDFLRPKRRSLQEGLESVLRLLPRGNHEELRRVLEASLNSYKACDSKLSAYFENDQIYSTLKLRSGHPVETWILKKIRQGLFPNLCMEVLTVGQVFFKPQVEDFSAASADQCSLGLRQSMYGILREGEVVEWKWQGLERDTGKRHRERQLERDTGKRHREIQLERDTVQPSLYLREFGELPNLRTIPGLERAVKRTICLSLLESNEDSILHLPHDLQLFAASVRYWKKHAQPAIKPNLLPAFLVCFLMLAEGRPSRDVQASRIPHARTFDLEAQHSFAQWQCVMREALGLNFILQEPLYTPLILRLYDGLLVQHLVSKLESDKNAYKSWQSKNEYKKLYNAVTQGM